MMQIIPAIDIIDGKCVRLTQGDYQQKKIYNESPVEVAKSFEDHGITRLHVVDLDGAKQQHIVNHKVLEAIASQTSLHIDFGGGIKSDEDIAVAFEAGARQVTGGSIAVKNPELFLRWLHTYGSEKIILGADARNRMVATNGWQEASSVDVVSFVEDYHQKGIAYVICTDIAKDGLLQGPSVDLYQEMLAQVKGLQLIASGGVSCMDDLHQLQAAGVYGVIIGKAFYEGRIKLTELKEFL